MSTRSIVLTLAVLLTLAGCESDSGRDWMKVNQSYTVEEFRRDLKECSPKGKLDDTCMHSRGWIDVKKTPEKPPDMSGREPFRR